MGSFNYYAPFSLSELSECLRDNTGKKLIFLAGGTDLINQLREKEVHPEVVVDLSRITGLRGVRQEGEKIIIGALTTFTDIVESELVNNYVPLLAEACIEVGSPQIRNRGTVGGNIANASPAADTVPPLIALEADVVIKGSSGLRQICLQDTLAGVNKNTLTEDEIITEIIFRKPDNYTTSGFIKLGRRAALAISRISMAGVIQYSTDYMAIEKARIALGSVGQNPFRAKKAEQILEQAELTNINGVTEEFVSMISNVVSESLGDRASAPFKRESIKGLARGLLHRLLDYKTG